MFERRRFLLCTGQVVKARDAWRYPEAHILGDIRHMALGDRRVPALALWLTPADTLHVPPIHPQIVAYILGEARLVRCRFEDCRRALRWAGIREITIYD